MELLAINPNFGQLGYVRPPFELKKGDNLLLIFGIIIAFIFAGAAFAAYWYKKIEAEKATKPPKFRPLENGLDGRFGIYV